MKIEAKPKSSIEFNETIEQTLIETLDPKMGLDGIIQAIKDGYINYVEIYGDDVFVGYLLVRFDKHYLGHHEFVVMYSQTLVKDFERPLHSFLGRVYEKLANGLPIRIHAERRCIEKLLEADGYTFQESVWKKEKY